MHNLIPCPLIFPGRRQSTVSHVCNSFRSQSSGSAPPVTIQIDICMIGRARFTLVPFGNTQQKCPTVSCAWDYERSPPRPPSSSNTRRTLWSKSNLPWPLPDFRFTFGFLVDSGLRGICGRVQPSRQIREGGAKNTEWLDRDDCVLATDPGAREPNHDIN